MALIGWYPFIKNGELINKGLSESLSLTSNNASFTSGGKIGSYCLTGGTPSATLPELKGKTQFSIAMWIYLVSANITSDWTCFCRIYDGSSNIRFETCPKSRSYSHISINNNSGMIMMGGSLNKANSNLFDSWHHIVVSSDGSTFYLYVDGIFIESCSGKNSTALTGYFQIENNNYVRKNDFRIYDHCLSPKEVKEISKGLVLHYPLNELYIKKNYLYNAETPNLMICGYNNSTYSKSSTTFTSGLFTGTFYTIINGSSGGGDYRLGWNDGHNGITMESTVNDVPITFSCWVYSTTNIPSFSCNMGKFSDKDISNLWDKSIQANTWTFCYGTKIFSSSSSNASSSNIELYFGHTLNTDITMAYGKLEYGNSPTQWTPYNIDYESKIYDCSGYENDGIASGIIRANILTGDTSLTTTLPTNCSVLGGCNSPLSYEWTSSGLHIVGQSTGNTNNGYNIYASIAKLGIRANDTITFSVDINGTCDHISIWFDGTDGNWWTGTNAKTSVGTTSTWKRYSVTLKAPASFNDDYIAFGLHAGISGDFYAKNIKVEFGLTSTDYTTSNSDVKGITGLTTSTNTPRYDKCTVFNNSCARYIAGPCMDFLTSSLTYNCWIYLTSRSGAHGSSTTSYGFVMSCGRDYDKYGCNLALDNGSPMLVINTSYIRSGVTIPLNEWHMLTGTWDGNTAKLYIDGVLKKSESNITSIDYTYTSNAFTLGKMSYNYTNTDYFFPFVGSISDARIYTTALSSEDIQELYNTSAFITDNGTLKGYLFEEIKPTDYSDLSNPTIEKSGEITVLNLYEISTDGEIYHNYSFSEYTPPSNTDNCHTSIGTCDFTGYKNGDLINFYFKFLYSGFNSSVNSNFRVATNEHWYNDTEGNWGKPMASNYMSLKLNILSSDSGIYELEYTYTLNSTYGGTNSTYPKVNLAIRFDYSNGIGKIKCLESRVSRALTKYIDSEQSRFGSDYITANQLIEI